MTSVEIQDWLKVDEDTADQVVHIMANSGSPETKMDAIDRVIGSYGIETIQVNGEVMAEYCNTGDTYSNTILYIYPEEKFELSTWGDIFEKYGDNARSDILSEYADYSVSCGTLELRYVIPAFMDFLEDLNTRLIDADVGEIVELYDLRTAVNSLEIDGDEYVDTVMAGYVFEDLFDLLNEYAPEGYCFGAHPDELSDYGFWASE